MSQPAVVDGTFSSKSTSWGKHAAPEKALTAAGTGLLIPQIPNLC